MLLNNPLFLGLFGVANKLPLTGVIIKYGIYTDIKNDKIISEMDNGLFKRLVVNATPQRAESCKLSLKVRSSRFSTFYGFVKSNFGREVLIDTQKINPFISDNPVEEVRIIGYSRPIRENEVYYSIELELRKV